MVIFKWSLEVTDLQDIYLPVGSKILDIQTQNGAPRLWTLCDETETRQVKRIIAIYGTGKPMPDNYGEYIATFQLHDGSLVFHAFEISNEHK